MAKISYTNGDGYDHQRNQDQDVTPSEAHQIAAKAFYDRLLNDSKQLDNMRYYCREMGRRLPCDVDPQLIQTGPSKDLRVRYGLNYSDNNVVWAILEDWFNSKLKDG